MRLTIRSGGVRGPLDQKQIDARIATAPCLPSLGSIEMALKELLTADQRYTSQIAEIIRRDPSLTARILHLVNSVYYGLSSPMRTIEEAVFFLGVRQVRQLAMMTPVVEDLSKMTTNRRLQWKQFWRHCIATAMMTYEIIDQVQPSEGETAYLAGLLHDVGKIVMASAFPEYFDEVYDRQQEQRRELTLVEREVLGVDHCELGARYLGRQRVPELFVEVARYHHCPNLASTNASTAAAVQVADMLVRYTTIGYSGNPMPVEDDSWLETPGWNMLFARQTDGEKELTRASLKRSLERVPAVLECLV
jgi:putative nucleotidyltransferase with HDIG domain